MRPLLLLLLTCTLLLSCNGPSYRPLTRTSIYDIDSVRLAMNGGDEKAAGKLLEQAAGLYKKGPDTAKSIELFKQSILLKPTAKAYYELSGALLSTHQYAEAIGALRITEKLGFTPLANVMYKYALAYSNLSGNDMDGTWLDSSRYYMELAIQMNYPRPQQFLRKDLFPALHSRSGFDEAYNDAMLAGSGNNKDKSLWEIFKSHFSPIQLPLVIDQAWINAHHGEDDVAYEFDKFIPEMRQDEFEREPSTEYFYVGLIASNSGYTALLYSTVPMEEEDTTLVGSFFLVTYNAGGKQIDKLQVAGIEELSAPFKVFSMQPSLQFSVQDFAYKDDPNTPAADSSQTKHREAMPPTAYRIAADGKFEKIETLALR